MRDGKPRGSRKRAILNDKIKRPYKRANGIISDTINRTISGITAGTDAVAHESLRIKGMTAHGGNHKRGSSRSMRGNSVGEFMPKLNVKCGMDGIDMVWVPPHQHNMPQVRPHTKSRVYRDTLICDCTSIFHADVNTARSILRGGESCSEAA